MITAIILNYKTPKASLSCAKQLSIYKEITSVILVNNAIEDKTINKSKIKNQKIHLVHSGKNLGYAMGNNFGIQYAVKNALIDKFILIVNSDIKIPDIFSFKPLIEKINNDLNIAVISPKIIDLNTKTNQGPYPKEHILINFMEVIFPPIFFLRKKIKSKIDDNSRYVYRTMGSFMLIDFFSFKKVNFFDSNTFLGSEEQILAEKFNLINKKFYHFANQFVYHDHGLTRKKVNNKLIEKYFLESKVYYFKSYRKSSKVLLSILKFSEKLKIFLNKYRN